MTTETKRQRSIRLLNQRVPKAMDSLRLVGQLANRAVYEYTESELQQVFAAIDESVAEMKAKFQKQEPKPRFQLQVEDDGADMMALVGEIPADMKDAVITTRELPDLSKVARGEIVGIVPGNVTLDVVGTDGCKASVETLQPAVTKPLTVPPMVKPLTAMNMGKK